MSEKPLDEERPCLHCMMVELIDDFFAENPATAGSDKVDTDQADEVIDAIAKTIAELTSQQDGLIRQQVIEQLMRQIMHYDHEFRREEATSAVSSHAKH
jgi:CHASE3 domain sensor protein